MSKHDTWVKLKPQNPFKNIEHLFPEGFPMRDPWAMGVGKLPNGETVSTWHIDIERLSTRQFKAIIKTIAEGNHISEELVISEVSKKASLNIRHDWIQSMWGGAENYRRSIELADFLATEPTESSYTKFQKQQYRDWIDGDRVPKPMPENYADIDPRFKTPKLELAYQQLSMENSKRYLLKPN